ncbi:hypothetical protein OB13_19635 [Pontibacter sp. HJ8]
MFRFSQKLNVSILAFVMLLLAGCTEQSRQPEEAAREGEAYAAGIAQWHQEREAKLKAADGWLTLAGLFWLQEGDNTFGSAESNDLVFPAGKIPAKAGVITLSGDSVTTTIAKGVEVQLNGRPVQEALLFAPALDTVPQLTHGSLTWFVIKRGDRYGVRLRDLQNEALTAFKGIARYPASIAWRVEAKLESHPTPKQIPITNVTGQTSQENSPGTLVFTVDGKQHRLDALEEGDQLFILFADKTNGLETYGAGRYLYADKPGADGLTVLDFNKATNPPCAFVPYATCPLPPRQNFLSIRVPAGEKAYGEQ